MRTLLLVFALLLSFGAFAQEWKPMFRCYNNNFYGEAMVIDVAYVRYKKVYQAVIKHPEAIGYFSKELDLYPNQHGELIFNGEWTYNSFSRELSGYLGYKSYISINFDNTSSGFFKAYNMTGDVNWRFDYCE